MKLTAEQRLHRAHVSLMSHKKFILMSGVLVSGNTEVVDDDKVTAYTDGLNVKYGRNFVTGLSDKQLNFLILHENFHKAFKHTTTWRHLYQDDPKLANKACDFVINLMIKRYDPYGETAEFIPGGCLDERFDGMDAQQIFRILKKEKEEGGGKGEGNEGEPYDEHGWEEAESWGEDKTQEVKRKIDVAIRQGEILLKKKGDAGSGGDRAFGELLDVKIDPYEVLREYMTSTCAERSDSTWSRPNRRFISQDLYMPSQIAEAMDSVIIANDMSGSIGQMEQSEFLTEMANICNSVMPEVTHILYWDTEVCAHEKYARDQLETMPQSTKPAGGGGTEVQCVRSYLKRNNVTAQVLVIFTDGYVGAIGDWSDMPPTVWVISSGGNKHGNYPGKVIHL